MTVADFSTVVEKIRPYTNYIYLHVLGEPLFHPQFDAILAVAHAAKLEINITTNGSLLEKKKDILLTHPVRQINISLHDAEENINPSHWETYISSRLEFAKMAAPKSYISLRLWNARNKGSKAFNELCTKIIQEKFNLGSNDFEMLKDGKNLKLSEHIFMHAAPRFEWPDADGKAIHTTKKCYGLRDHIAILSNGAVVPCCLDADAHLLLGNIFEENLTDIINKERAIRIKSGFENGQAVEDFCKTCGFR